MFTTYVLLPIFLQYTYSPEYYELNVMNIIKKRRGLVDFRFYFRKHLAEKQSLPGKTDNFIFQKFIDLTNYPKLIHIVFD